MGVSNCEDEKSLELCKTGGASCSEVIQAASSPSHTSLLGAFAWTFDPISADPHHWVTLYTNQKTIPEALRIGPQPPLRFEDIAKFRRA